LLATTTRRESMPDRVDWEELSQGLPLVKSGDEISLTVQDTNALRVKLGLRPLNSEESSSALEARAAAERNYALAKAARQEARKLADIEKELAKAKRKREAAAMNGASAPSLGDTLPVESSADWVEKHKKHKSSLEAEKMARILAERDEIPRIAASTQLKAGEETILTLRDASILARTEDGRVVGLNDEDDAMENVQLAQDAKRKKQLRDAKRDLLAVRAGGYDATDDAEFLDEDSSSLGMRLGSDTTTVKPFRGEGAVAASLRTAAWAQAPAVQEETTETTLQTDYMSPEEAKKFFKKRGAKAKQQRRRKAVLDDDDGEQDGDRMTREEALKRKHRREADEADAARRKKDDSFRRAREKQQAKVDVGLGRRQDDQVTASQAPDDEAPTTKSLEPKEEPPKEEEPTKKPKFVAGLGGGDDDDDDDAELRAALARARTANLLLEPKQPVPAVAKKEEEEEEGENNTSGGGGLVFTSTTEFTTRLHARLEERAAETATTKSAAAAPTSRKEGASSLEEENAEDADAASEAGSEIEFLHRQPLASGGVAGAMDLFRATGDLRPTKPKEVQLGRARDRREFDDDGDDQESEVTLEYRDADGRLLTRREAFRQLCHRFHGKAPGKKKLEKFQAKLKEDQRSMKHNTGSGSLSILKHVQEKTGSAYIPIHNQATVSSLAAAAGVEAPGGAGGLKKKQKKKKSSASK